MFIGVPSNEKIFKRNGRVTGEKGVENYFGGVESFLFETLLWNGFGKSETDHE
jgi:hypothetical protein